MNVFDEIEHRVAAPVERLKLDGMIVDFVEDDLRTGGDAQRQGQEDREGGAIEHGGGG